jgi:hypothetical protein
MRVLVINHELLSGDEIPVHVLKLLELIKIGSMDTQRIRLLQILNLNYCLELIHSTLRTLLPQKEGLKVIRLRNPGLTYAVMTLLNISIPYLCSDMILTVSKSQLKPKDQNTNR